MEDVRLAISGAGVIGRRHIKAITESARCVLVGIADPFPATKELAEEAGIPCFDSTDVMLASLVGARSIEGVIVATPTEHHLQPTLQALDAGVHVLVEKPIMATFAEAQQVIEKSANVQKHVLVGHQRRYYAQVHKARQMVQSGSLGQLVAVSGQWNMRKHVSYYNPDWRKKWKAGPVLTNLIHELDALRYICGEISSISAESSHDVQNFEKEDVAALVVRFESGALGTFILSDQSTSPWSWESATGENVSFPKSGQNCIRFMGTEASLEFPNLVLWHHGDETPDWNHALQRQEIPMDLEDAYIAQVDHFAEVIRGGIEPRITAADAARSLQATLAVFESARLGKKINL